MSSRLQPLEQWLDCPTKAGWLKLVLLSSSLAIAACQSVPQQNSVTHPSASSILSTNQTAASKTATSQPPTRPAEYRPLAVRSAGIPGLTDLKWNLISINSKNPQPFINQPYLFLQSATKAVSGSTGCNALTGNYLSNEPLALKIQALAGHMACEDALAQEAEIMDVLGRVTRYQLQQNMLYLYDNNGALLMTARTAR